MMHCEFRSKPASSSRAHNTTHKTNVTVSCAVIVSQKPGNHNMPVERCMENIQPFPYDWLEMLQFPTGGDNRERSPWSWFLCTHMWSNRTVMARSSPLTGLCCWPVSHPNTPTSVSTAEWNFSRPSSASDWCVSGGSLSWICVQHSKPALQSTQSCFHPQASLENLDNYQ